VEERYRNPLVLDPPQTKKHTEQLAEVAGLYTLEGRQEVIDFLNDHAFLLPLLLSATADITHYFPNTQCAIQVVTDPDELSRENATTLVLYIPTTLEPQEASAALERLEDALWPTIAGQDQGKLCINLAFR